LVLINQGFIKGLKTPLKRMLSCKQMKKRKLQ